MMIDIVRKNNCNELCDTCKNQIGIIHSYEVHVINADNKMITLARIGRIIWINQITKRTTNTTEIISKQN